MSNPDSQENTTVTDQRRKGAWTAEEDQKLIAYITRYGIWNWTEMPKAAGLLRSGKSCRLRWMNYLRPDIRRGNFSQEEIDTIIQLHALHGNRWSTIAARLPGRTDNEIKNFWNLRIRRRLMTGSTVNEVESLDHNMGVALASISEDQSNQFNTLLPDQNPSQLFNSLQVPMEILLNSSSSFSTPTSSNLVLNSINSAPSVVLPNYQPPISVEGLISRNDWMENYSPCYNNNVYHDHTADYDYGLVPYPDHGEFLSSTTGSVTYNLDPPSSANALSPESKWMLETDYELATLEFSRKMWLEEFICDASCYPLDANSMNLLMQERE